MSIALITLFIRCMNQLLAAAHLARTGYYLGAFPLLRDEVECAELMEYFLLEPSDVQKWVNKHRDFDYLGWLRDRLPRPDLKRNFYDAVNNFVHPNFLETQHYCCQGDVAGARVFVVGPFPLEADRVNPIAMAVAHMAYPIRILWRHDLDVVSGRWVEKFEEFDRLTGYPFSSKAGAGSSTSGTPDNI